MTIVPTKRLISLVILTPQDGDTVDCSNIRVEGTVDPPPGTGANDSTVSATIVMATHLGITNPLPGTTAAPTSGLGSNFAVTFSTTALPGTVIILTVTATTPDGDTLSVQIQLTCQGFVPVPTAGVPTLTADFTRVTMPPQDAIAAGDKKLIVDGIVTPALGATTTLFLSGEDGFSNLYFGHPHPSPSPQADGKWSLVLFNVPTPLNLKLILVAVNGNQFVPKVLTLNTA